ncbi:hypothetical protein [Pseudomonas sp. SWI44]|uniref:hypothetical protein n=1 Tax=Pseudomonas sp. SWI44 TaxID=2083053 RepID=UPI001319EF37|nr:hypothetical protein [Pseudomonas sp. SWI44]
MDIVEEKRTEQNNIENVAPTDSERDNRGESSISENELSDKEREQSQKQKNLTLI